MPPNRPREVVHVHRDLDTFTPRHADRARGSTWWFEQGERYAASWRWPGYVAANDHGRPTRCTMVYADGTTRSVPVLP